MADINLGVGGANSAVAGGYDIDNSLKFESNNSEYLYYTSTTQTDYERMAFSLWIKRTELGNAMLAEFGNGTSNTSNLRIGFDSSDRLFCYGNSIIFRQTNQVFRDTSAWYHLFFLFDTTTPGGISNNRIRIWVNGEMIPHTEFGVINNPGAGAAMGFNNGLQQSIGAQREDGPKNYFNGYMAQVYGSGGTPPVVTDFGEFDEDTGIWKPIDISELTPPDTQGFNLDFSDASNLGNDISTRNNNFTLQNITAADQATDTPTNNFTIPNVIGTTRTNKFTYTEGGTKVVSAGSTDWDSWANTIAVGNGKWYAEFKIINTGNYFVGVGSEEYYFIGAGNGTGFPEIYYGYSGTNSVGFYNTNGDIYNNGTQVVIGTTYATNDIISVALDMDNGKVYFAKNGTYIDSQNPVTGTNAQNLPDTEARYFIGTSQYQASLGVECNYGGYTTTSIASGNSDANGYGNFEYAPPSGYYALCTKNLAEYG